MGGVRGDLFQGLVEIRVRPGDLGMEAADHRTKPARLHAGTPDLHQGPGGPSMEAAEPSRPVADQPRDVPSGSRELR
jgi:hypothetical protein